MNELGVLSPKEKPSMVRKNQILRGRIAVLEKENADLNAALINRTMSVNKNALLWDQAKAETAQAKTETAKAQTETLDVIIRTKRREELYEAIIRHLLGVK